MFLFNIKVAPLCVESLNFKKTCRSMNPFTNKVLKLMFTLKASHNIFEKQLKYKVYHFLGIRN